MSGMTIEDVVFKLCDQHHTAWLALPKQIQELMVSKPEMFQLSNQEEVVGGCLSIICRGIAFKYVSKYVGTNYAQSYWAIDLIPISPVPTSFCVEVPE